MENAGVKLMNNPDCIETTVDKYYTSTLLEDHGIPTLRTVVTERFEDAMDAFRMMGDAIVKPLFGSLGLGMVRISDEDTAHRVLRLGRHAVMFTMSRNIFRTAIGISGHLSSVPGLLLP